VGIAGLSLLIASTLNATVSSLWTQYTEAKAAGTETTLADFSCAGYRHGEVPLPTPQWRVFDVTDYGAVADDGLSDKVAIQAAINAAVAHGSGIVFFPPGRFRINEPSESNPWVNTPIVVRGSNIVLRGSGHGPGGTELFAERHMNLRNETQLWTAPAMIHFLGTGKRSSPADYLAAPANRGTHTITTTNTPDFAPGDWVVLEMQDNRPDSVAAVVAPHAVESGWTDLINNGVRTAEIHQVASIGSNTITFKEPVHMAMPTHAEASHHARVIGFAPLTEVGVEDIAFVGNWKTAFVHHAYYLDDAGKRVSHDSAWSALEFSNTVNSWIRDCRFTDWNYGIKISVSAAVTVLRIELDGNPGHNALTMNSSSHCFAGMIHDRARHWHACGVAGLASGNVFWQSEYSADSCFEAHSSQPRWTLFDAVAGGWMYGRWGGSVSNQPNHLRGLVLWNYRNTGPGVAGAFHFFRPSSVYGRIVMPYIVGFHGRSQSFAESTVEVLESNGTPVEPQSLYEAQYKLRHGRSLSRLLYAEWAHRFDLSPADSALDADPDQDSVSNLIEYATGGNPTAGQTSPGNRPDFPITTNSSGLQWTFSYPRRRHAEKLGLSYLLEQSTTLQPGSWSATGVAPVALPINDNFELVTGGAAATADVPLFLRLQVGIAD
jgi:hypothetical protein